MVCGVPPISLHSHVEAFLGAKAIAQPYSRSYPVGQFHLSLHSKVGILVRLLGIVDFGRVYLHRFLEREEMLHALHRSRIGAAAGRYFRWPV